MRFRWPMPDHPPSVPGSNVAQGTSGDGEAWMALIGLRITDNGFKVYEHPAVQQTPISPLEERPSLPTLRTIPTIPRLFGVQSGQIGTAVGGMAATNHGPMDTTGQGSKGSIQTMLANQARQQGDHRHEADEALWTLTSSLRNVAMETEDRTQWYVKKKKKKKKKVRILPNNLSEWMDD